MSAARAPRRDGSVIDALLGSSEPSIRWKARVHVLGEDRGSKGIRALEEEIRTSPRALALLGRRDRLGRAGTARAVYYKWQGLHWVLEALRDLGYPRGDETLHPIRDRVLDLWLKPAYFKEFEARTAAESYERQGQGVPRIEGRYRRCASQQGNALYSLVVLGIADDRAHLLAERLLHWQWPDGGWNCDRRPKADTSSFMETRHAMLGLHAYGQVSPARSKPRLARAAAAAARKASEVFLKRRLYKRASDGTVIHPEFTALHYPLYWHYDVLAGLKAMAALGRIRDPRCADALDLLERKRLPDGGWPAEKRYWKSASREMRTYADHVDWGPTGKRRMNEWVTVDALAVLSAAGRIRV